MAQWAPAWQPTASGSGLRRTSTDGAAAKECDRYVSNYVSKEATNKKRGGSAAAPPSSLPPLGASSTLPGIGRYNVANPVEPSFGATYPAPATHPNKKSGHSFVPRPPSQGRSRPLPNAAAWAPPPKGVSKASPLPPVMGMVCSCPQWLVHY